MHEQLQVLRLEQCLHRLPRQFLPELGLLQQVLERLPDLHGRVDLPGLQSGVLQERAHHLRGVFVPVRQLLRLLAHGLLDLQRAERHGLRKYLLELRHGLPGLLRFHQPLCRLRYWVLHHLPLR